MDEERKEFPSEVSKQLKWYVYRLIDPRNGETFYVGKGRKNRVYDHIRAEDNLKGDELDNKIERIRTIKVAGFKVGHIIHRHGMTNRTALEVEAALIDAYPGLTNVVSGHDSGERGAMHAEEAIQQYGADVAKFAHRALLINVSRSATRHVSIYEATRYAWRVNKDRAKDAEVVLATVHGVIRDAFVEVEWLPATPENFPDRPPVSDKRWGFRLKESEASREMRQLYVGKRVPAKYRTRNPIRYTYPWPRTVRKHIG